VATRSVAANGLGLPVRDALENLAEFRRVVRLLPEEKPLLPTLLALLQQVPCQGKAVHDALLVATMVVHKVKLLVTSNPGHFERFRSLVRVFEPAERG
jgi:predicted nucleic acid-binding protein